MLYAWRDENPNLKDKEFGVPHAHFDGDDEYMELAWIQQKRKEAFQLKNEVEAAGPKKELEHQVEKLRGIIREKIKKKDKEKADENERDRMNKMLQIGNGEN